VHRTWPSGTPRRADRARGVALHLRTCGRPCRARPDRDGRRLRAAIPAWQPPAQAANLRAGLGDLQHGRADADAVLGLAVIDAEARLARGEQRADVEAIGVPQVPDREARAVLRIAPVERIGRVLC